MNRFSIQLQKNLHHFKLRPTPSSCAVDNRWLAGVLSRRPRWSPEEKVKAKVASLSDTIIRSRNPCWYLDCGLYLIKLKY